MKKYIFVAFICIVLIITGCQGKSENNCLYNDFEWGISKEEVIAEKGEPDSYTDFEDLKYVETFMDGECDVTYRFSKDDKYCEVLIEPKNTYAYSDLKKKYSKQYGDPFDVNEIDDNFGGVNRATWEVGYTGINVTVFNDDSHKVCIVYYNINVKSKEVEYLEEQTI